MHDPVSPAIAIRSAMRGNVDAVVSLLENADLPAEDVPAVFGDCFAVAVHNDSIVGTAGVERHGDVGLFRSAAVRADQRGKGIGEALTRNRIEWSTAQGISELYLLTTTAADYFPRYGFEKVERDSVPPEIASTSEFTSLCPSSATVMRLKLRS